jgi:hypothetical protein
MRGGPALSVPDVTWKCLPARGRKPLRRGNPHCCLSLFGQVAPPAGSDEPRSRAPRGAPSQGRPGLSDWEMTSERPRPDRAEVLQGLANRTDRRERCHAAVEATEAATAATRPHSRHVEPWPPGSTNASGHEMAVFSGRIVGRRMGTIGGIMKKSTGVRLFAGPEITRKAKARLARAKLVIVAARERAADMAQQSPAKPLTTRPTVLQRRRLAERLSALRP